jgi:ribonuclease P protein component
LAERNKLPRKATLKSRKEIDRLLKSGHRQSGDYFVLVWDKSDCFRYGVFVPGRYGSAVKRNRLKRLVREAIRLNRHLLEEPRVVGVLPKRGTDELGFEQVDRDIRALFQRIGGTPA